MSDWSAALFLLPEAFLSRAYLDVRILNIAIQAVRESILGVQAEVEVSIATRSIIPVSDRVLRRKESQIWQAGRLGLLVFFFVGVGMLALTAASSRASMLL